MANVPMPTNVRVRLLDGSVYPVDLILDGLDEDGCHRWRQVRPGPFPLSQFGGPRSIMVDELPDKTSIVIALDEDR